MTFHKDSSETSSGYHFRTQITKSTGKAVPIGMFADEQHNHVSGAIWSKTTLGNFFQDRNDLAFFPNTTPAVSLKPGWMDWGIEWEASVDDDGQCSLIKLV